jgi:hypothetical protein
MIALAAAPVRMAVATGTARPEVQKTAYSRFMTASMPMFWGNVQSK